MGAVALCGGLTAASLPSLPRCSELRAPPKRGRQHRTKRVSLGLVKGLARSVEEPEQPSEATEMHAEKGATGVRGEVRAAVLPAAPAADRGTALAKGQPINAALASPQGRVATVV